MWQLGLPEPELQYRVDFPDGTFALRCASEVAVAGGLVIKAGSWMRLREIDAWGRPAR